MPNANRIKIQAIGFAIVGILGVAVVDRVSISFVTIENHSFFGVPFFIGVSFFIVSAMILYLLLRRTSQIAEEALMKLSAHQRQEKENLQLFNFALDKSADAIYWFTFDTQFFYVNDAACKQLGYTKQELLTMKLSDIDKDYKKNTPDFLIHIRQKQYICFESQQTRHDGSTFPVSISASYFVMLPKNLFVHLVAILQRKKKSKNLSSNKIMHLKIHFKIKKFYSTFAHKT